MVSQTLYSHTVACSPASLLMGRGGGCEGGEGGQRSQEGSANEGRANEGQRNSKTRFRYLQPATRERRGIGYGDDFSSAVSAFTAALVGFHMETRG